MSGADLKERIATLKDAVARRARLREQRKVVVFTNGVFDILHRGHVEYLFRARALGDALYVGMNSDSSVARLKGASRPVVPLEDRALVLASLRSVDLVIPFGEDTPLDLITALLPDVLVKGADWPIEKVVGREVVEQAGGAVRTIEFVENRSTTLIIEKIRSSSGRP